MNSQDKHITPWSASDVRKYLEGELSPREMHQLEKAALEDPFLADAIEGFSQHPAVEKDFDELQTRLAARVNEKKARVIVAPWMRVAAAIALLAGLGFTAWYTLLDHSKDKLAKTVSKTAPAAPLPSLKSSRADTTKESLQPSTALNTQPSVAATTPEIASLPKQKTSALRTRPVVSSGGIVPDAEAEKSTADSIELLLKNKAASLDITPSPANRLVLDSTAVKKQMLEAVIVRNNVVLNGQVLDRNNRPLAGASLLVSGPSNVNTITNALGQFQLYIRPQDTVQRLTVALEGYQNASLAVNTLNAEAAIGNTIFLRENPSALNEVVVSGMGRNRKEAFATAPYEDKNEKLDSFWIKVAPVGGRLTYLQYLETAKKTLPVDSTIHGTEIISFEVGPKGVPSAFKIEQSLSPAHDAGVIRLISEGAGWKTNHGKIIRAMVSVTFP